MIKKIRRHMFVTNRANGATNNGSVRGVACAIFRKISDGFRTGWGAKLYAGIHSVIETARRRAITAPIRLIFAGKPVAAAL